MHLRRTQGAAARIVTSKIDVSEAYRQVPVDPPGGHVFCRAVADVVVSGLRSQLGWRSSSGLLALTASALEYSYSQTIFRRDRI